MSVVGAAPPPVGQPSVGEGPARRGPGARPGSGRGAGPTSRRGPGSGRGTATALVAVAVAGLTGTGALLVRDPHVPGSWGSCPLLATTGVACPGCGGLRAVADLAHGDLVAALSSNALVVVLLAVVGGAWVLAALGLVLGRTVAWERVVTGWTTTLLVLGVAAFSVLRNTPLAASLMP